MVELERVIPESRIFGPVLFWETLMLILAVIEGYEICRGY